MNVIWNAFIEEKRQINKKSGSRHQTFSFMDSAANGRRYQFPEKFVSDQQKWHRRQGSLNVTLFKEYVQVASKNWATSKYHKE